MSPVAAVTERTLAMGSLDQHQGDEFCSISFNDSLTEELQKAADQAEREGSEMPLVRQQLRYKIQLQRLKGGKGELKVEFEEPKKYELTEEEKQKQTKRKLRNREAAKKSRIRKKTQHSQLQKENSTLMTKKAELKSQVDKLRKMCFAMQTAVHKSRICHSNHPHRGPHQHLSTGVLPGSRLVVSRNSHNGSASLHAAAQRKFVIMGQGGGVPVTDSGDTNVSSSYAISARQSGHGGDSPTQPAFTVGSGGLSGFAPSLPASIYVSPTSTSSPPAVANGQGVATESPQDNGESFMDFLDTDVVGEADEAKGLSFLFLHNSQYVKPASKMGWPSTVDALASPGSPSSSDPMFGAAQTGLPRGP